MKRKIVGYGSLLAPKGWNVSLKRNINWNDLEYVKFDGYKRTWTAFTKVKINNKEIEGCFLDISEDKNSICNGFALEVTNEEFEIINTREKDYELKDITKNIENPEDGFTYYTSYRIKKTPENKDNAFVLENYINIVVSCLNDMTKEQNNIYQKTTRIPEYPIISGDYRFIDESINKAINK